MTVSCKYIQLLEAYGRCSTYEPHADSQLLSPSLPVISIGFRAWELSVGPKLTPLSGKAWKESSLIPVHFLMQKHH